jgi:putative ABC transport system permease protein
MSVIAMKAQDFRIGLRLLLKDPAYSLVAVLGLAVGLAVFLLLLGFARYCWQYNSQVPDADDVYIVKQRNNLELGTPWYDQAPLLLLAAARTAPGVTNATGYLTWFPLTVEIKGQLRGLRSLTVLPGFPELMGLHALKGDLNAALSRPDSFAIAEGAAVRLFGTADVLGRTVLLRLDAVDQNSSVARIAAVLPDPPANTTIPYETLNGPNLGLIPQFMRAEALSGQSAWLSNLLLRVHPGSSLTAIKQALQRAADEAPSARKVPPEMKDRLGARKVMDVRLAPLRDAYFDREVATNFLSQPVDRGDVTVVNGLVAIAFLILALAGINYVNLATIRVVRRQREIAMRKVLGAGRQRLTLQFIAESLLVSILATVAGLLLASLALPLFAALMDRDLRSVLSPGNIAAALGIGLILGLLTALYPAWVALRVPPSLILAGRPCTESPRIRRLRQVFSVVQVAVAIALVSFTAAISLQTRFAMDASPGFDPSSWVVVQLPVGEWSGDEKARGLRAALAQQPGIAGVAVSSDPVGRSKEAWSTEIRREGGAAVTMDVKAVSPDFFGVYGIRSLAGRLFDPRLDRDDDAGPVILNEIGAHSLGFASPQLAIGQTLLFRNPAAGGESQLIAKRIVGIAPEIRFYSLREVPGAIAYDLWGGTTLTVRASGSVADAEQAVRSVWPRYFPNSVLEMSPARDVYAANYADDARLARLLWLATAIAILIAAFGTHVLAADAVERRTGEIALRRLFGASRRDICKLIAGEVGSVVLLSAVIALPLAALAIARYLAPFTERTPSAFWMLAVATVAALAIASLAAARHTWIAMSLKPAVALRS